MLPNTFQRCMMLAHWLLKKKAGHAGGVRLSKWKKFEPPKLFTPSQYNLRALPAHYRPAAGIQDGDKYRFFTVTQVTDGGTTSEIAVCRCCGHVCYSENERRTHLRAMGCSKKLVEAYKLLLRDMKCVVCDVLSRTQKWGVPLHMSCEKAWMEELAAPSGLEGAFMVLEARGGF